MKLTHRVNGLCSYHIFKLDNSLSLLLIYDDIIFKYHLISRYGFFFVDWLTKCHQSMGVGRKSMILYHRKIAGILVIIMMISWGQSDSAGGRALALPIWSLSQHPV